MAISTLVLVASTWLAGTSASYASVNRVNAPLTIGTSPRPGQAELVHLTQGSIHPPEDECLEHTCKDQGSFANNIYECPSLNGNTRVTPNGDPHKIYCGVQNDHATLRRATTDSFIACVDTCSEDEECVGVGWNHTDSVCTMKTEYMTPTLPSVENINIDSASEQCPSLDPEVKRCQAVNGKIHCDFGEQFKLFYSMYKCVEICAGDTRCKGVDFGPYENVCALKSNYVETPTWPAWWGDSAVFIGRRG